MSYFFVGPVAPSVFAPPPSAGTQLQGEPLQKSQSRLFHTRVSAHTTAWALTPTRMEKLRFLTEIAVYLENERRWLLWNVDMRSIDW